MTDVLHYPSTSSEEARPGRPTLLCRAVADEVDLELHHRVRHEVFVVEQGLFVGSDVDSHDADPATIHLVGLVDDAVAGAVRLWPSGGGRWHGDRLAVTAKQRHAGLGRPLVRLAVRTATQAGGALMTAHVQVRNVRFFEALGWSAVGGIEDYVGAPHQLMTITLR